MPSWFKVSPAECPLVWIDTETGGLDPARAALLEVAVIVTDITGQLVRDRWGAKIIPDAGDVIQKGATKINGYQSSTWEMTAVDGLQAVREILRVGRGGILAGHNVRFDEDVLMRVAGRDGVTEWPGPHYRVDTVALAWPLLALGLVRSLKLTALTAALGIPHVHAHTAMDDAEAARQVYIRLIELTRGGLRAKANR